jgi:hypothetical protein
VAYDYVDTSGSHSGVFALDNARGLQTFTVNLGNVTSFTMHTGDSNANLGPGVQLDNVRFNGSLTPSDAPEPATWALMIGGFGLAGVVMRRRRSAVAA